MDDRALLQPERERADIEWSIALSRGAASTDRFVVYGLEREEMSRYLELRGVDGEALFQDLLTEYGAPFQVAVGQDGARTKAYWFLESADPAFFGVDCVDGAPRSRKRYRLLEPEDVSQVLDPRLHPAVGWLLAREEFAGERLLHLVALKRRERDEHYSGVHVGLSPDWLGLVGRDPGLRREGLVQDFLAYLGLSHHLEAVRAAVLEPPMAWVCYLSVLVRPDGSLGANLYARSNPVEWRDGGCWLTEPGRGGVVPRPAILTWCLRGEPGVAVRMRWHGEDPCFFESNGWRVEYRSEETDDELRARGVFERMRRVTDEVVISAGPDEPARCLRQLQSCIDVVDAWLGPDMRYRP